MHFYVRTVETIFGRANCPGTYAEVVTMPPENFQDLLDSFPFSAEDEGKLKHIRVR